MTYDYLSINYTAVAGILFLMIFLLANASLDPKIRRIFFLLILLEAVEIIAYSAELHTTTFPTLHPARLWLSAIGYSVRPFIFCLILMLATRNTTAQQFPKAYLVPALLNVVTAFSVFFTDIVYSYSPDNQFHRGPLGYITYAVVLLYLIFLILVVIRNHAGRPKLETLIIFAICALIVFAMLAEALYSIRTLGRSSIVMATIFYYMFFQTQIYRSSLSQEQTIRQQLEHANRLDGTTGVLNKSAFTEAAKTLLEKHNTQPYPTLGFLFLDLDHLKHLNDTLGHTMGDLAIADAVDAIQAIYRRTDLIGRFGGDEFCVLLPNIPRHRFQTCLEAIQCRLEREYCVDHVSVRVTASIGAVYSEANDLTYEKLVSQADEALYEAKAAGRNCHVIREL